MGAKSHHWGADLSLFTKASASPGGPAMHRPLVLGLTAFTLCLPSVVAHAGWIQDGTPVSTTTNNQTSPGIIPDGLGGVIVTWEDHRSGTNSDVYAQRVNATGDVLWVTDGLPISTAPNDQRAPTIATDGQGGAIITWHDYQGGMSFDIYAQRVDAFGNILWTSNGVPVSTAVENQLFPTVISDGQSGAIISWEDYRTPDADIYAQRVNAAGAVLWTPDGAPLSTAGDDQLSTVRCPCNVEDVVSRVQLPAC